MPQWIKKWTRIQDDEFPIFLWSLLLLFLLRSAAIILNNFAETVFLKRFGVTYLPFMYMINSLVTFTVMAILAGWLSRTRNAAVLSRVLLFCGITTALLRPVLLADLAWLYPFLFILKSQFEILLGLLFWNLANDLFNVRQSKRIFPLIVAGGVTGEIIGSLLTPAIGIAITIDNLLLVYSATTLTAFLAFQAMQHRFPFLLPPAAADKQLPDKPSLTRQFSDIRALSRETLLVPILILLTLLPNIVIPVLNYQFNFAVNSRFSSEAGIIEFFGYFRGFMNFISLILLLFVGRIYNRIGLATALLFHPLNYLMVFISFFLRFDIVTAMYARISTNVIRTTFNKPVTDVLMGLLPASFRARIRPFLRGTVVRLGLFTGSGLILLSETWLHPSVLSLLAIPLILFWLLTVILLKKKYTHILTGLLSRNLLNLRAIEGQDVTVVFKDAATRQMLVRSFAEAAEEEALWYARLLRTLSFPDEALNRLIIEKLPSLATPFQVALLDLIRGQTDEAIINRLETLADPQQQPQFIAVVKTLKRIQADSCALLSAEMMAAGHYPEVRAYAATCVFKNAPLSLQLQVHAWLGAAQVQDRKAGVVAAGESGDATHIPRLEALLRSKDNVDLIPALLRSFARLAPATAQQHALKYLDYPDIPVRLAALEVVEIKDDPALAAVISRLGDPDPKIQHKAGRKIQTAPYLNGSLLIEALNQPIKRLRKALFHLLKTLDIKERDTHLFIQGRIEDCYRNLTILDFLSGLPLTTGKNLLQEHLEQKITDNLESLFRVLSLKDTGSRFQVIHQNLFSSDHRRQANAIELMEEVMAPRLFQVLLPLLDGSPPAQALATGRKMFTLPNFGQDIHRLYRFLLNGKCWVSSVHAMACIREDSLLDRYRDQLQHLYQSELPIIRQEAALMINSIDSQSSKEDHRMPDLAIAEKIVHLKKIDIFKKLSINELAAIASVAHKEVYEAGHVLFRQNDPADTMYLILEGELTPMQNGKEAFRLFSPGQSFGEAALLLDETRLLTLQANTRAELLVLHKREFIEIVMEYPQIGLEISRVLADRIKQLLKQLGSQKNDNFEKSQYQTVL